MTDLDLPLDVRVVSLDDLLPDPANPLRIAAAELDALERSIRAHGLVQPLVVRAANNQLIGGHQRWIAARRAGLTQATAVFLDLDEDRARVLGVALNRIGGEFDRPLLARLLADLSDRPGVDLALTGLGPLEIRGLLHSLDARAKRDRPESFDLERTIAEASATMRVRRGDVWALGEHRIGCGDATERGDVAGVLGASRARMLFTDPPYGVRLGDHGGQQRNQRRRRIANDDLAPEAFEAFVRGWATTVVSSCDGAVYICMSSKELPTVCRILAEAGAHWSDTIIWAKDRFVVGRANYQRGYEPIWFGWRAGAKPYWSGARDQSDVWQIDRPSSSPLHPTMKPLELMERALKNSSQEGDVVFDPFLGSGSTLIACDRTGRICAGLEIDPVFAEVTIRRWEQFTGGTAVRVTPDADRVDE